MDGDSTSNKGAPTTVSMVAEVGNWSEGTLLAGAILADYPGASQVLLSFPDDWEIVAKLTRGERTIYVGAFAPEQQRPDRDHFCGLSAATNLALDRYRHYKFFTPWAMPSLYVRFVNGSDTGHVVGYGPLRVQMREVGQAQVWYSSSPRSREELDSAESASTGGVALIWECYTFTTCRDAGWLEGLSALWQVIECDLNAIGIRQIYTQPKEPTISDGYEDLLLNLGYAPDGECPAWWSKVPTMEMLGDAGINSEHYNASM